MRLNLLLTMLLLSACATRPDRMSTEFLISPLRVSEHRHDDDLLSAGLGLEGLRAAVAPAAVDPLIPTPTELRRRAIHANWRGIADLSPAGAYGLAYGGVPAIPGREFSAFARIPGAGQPHRVLAQVPDGFDQNRRCLVVTASSGSRGIYGAIALAGAWGLPRGCAVAYTDKGAGTGYFDPADGSGVALDGSRAQAGKTLLEFEPAEATTPGHRIAMKHAHSGDHPEADWGRHVLQATRFGLHALNEAFPEQAPFTAENTRIIATGVSNGAGAVLRAAELEGGEWFDAVVVAAPNISVQGGRALFDYASQAALLQPCALLAMPDAPNLLPPAVWQAQARQRCASLAAAGVLREGSAETQAAEALAQLKAGGWSDNALLLANLNTSFDLWRLVLGTYLQSYLRAPVSQPVCGYEFTALSADGSARPATPAERASWWSDTSGIAPAGVIQMRDTLATGSDPALPGLRCVQALLSGSDAQSQALGAAIAATRASAQPRSANMLIVHGGHDSLIPIDFSSRAYVTAAQAAGHPVSLWEIERAQHFDAFLGAPPLGHLYPLLAYTYAALDRMDAVLDGSSGQPESALIRPRQRKAGSTLERDMLMLP